MRLYADLAEWWPLLSPPGDYADEAAALAPLLTGAPRCDDRRPHLLELGSGGGHLACHLADRFDLTLVDRSPQMLDQSRRLNPGSRHVVGDMRTVRLGETCEAVLIHDAVAHLTAPDDVAAALATARAHLAPGGVVVVCPDWTAETFRPGVATGGTDGPDRGLRYLEWTRPGEDGRSYTVDLAYLLREPTGGVRVVHDHAGMGLFARAHWSALLAGAGFADPIRHTVSGRDVFRAVVP